MAEKERTLTDRVKSAAESVYDAIGGRATEDMARQAASKIRQQKKRTPKGRDSGRR